MYNKMGIAKNSAGNSRFTYGRVGAKLHFFSVFLFILQRHGKSRIFELELNDLIKIYLVLF